MVNQTLLSNFFFVEWYQYQNTHYRLLESKRNAMVTSVLGNEDNNRNFIAPVYTPDSNWLISTCVSQLNNRHRMKLLIHTLHKLHTYCGAALFSEGKCNDIKKFVVVCCT